MRHWKTILTVLLLLTPTMAFGQASPNRDPARARLITDDIANFWRAYDLATKATTTEEKEAIYQREYFDKGSAGLKDFTRLRIGSAKKLVEAIKERPGYYASIRPDMERIPGQEGQIRAATQRLKQLYPDAEFPDVYVLIGTMNSAGTASENGLLIGGEMFGRNRAMPDAELNAFYRRVLRRVGELPVLVTHELIHYQQKNRNTEDTLLHAAIIEGGADFVGKLTCGKNSNAILEPFGNAHERQLWEEFAPVMQRQDISNWFYQGDRAKDRPADLGYYIGYKICEAYYNRARDKKAAIREILETKDVTALLKASGYADKFVLPTGQ